AAGGHYPKPPASYAAAKAAASGGSTTSVLILNVATSLKKKMNSSLNSIAFLVTSRWSLIAGRLPGRTDNEIKNYWNTHIRRKLLNRGIDPATHRPLNDPNHHQTTTTNHNVTTPHDVVPTISFSTPTTPITTHNLIKPELQQEDIKTINNNNININNIIIMNPLPENDQERCPDLNLELRIGPPHHHNQNDVVPYHRPAFMTGGRTSGGGII
ncbi:hypothetical protein M8C21_001782, partial [Ambrosia artemisiifolia]